MPFVHPRTWVAVSFLVWTLLGKFTGLTFLLVFSIPILYMTNKKFLALYFLLDAIINSRQYYITAQLGQSMFQFSNTGFNYIWPLNTVGGLFLWMFIMSNTQGLPEIMIAAWWLKRKFRKKNPMIYNMLFEPKILVVAEAKMLNPVTPLPRTGPDDP